MPCGCSTAFNSSLSRPVPTCLLSEERRGFRHLCEDKHGTSQEGDLKGPLNHTFAIYYITYYILLCNTTIYIYIYIHRYLIYR